MSYDYYAFLAGKATCPEKVNEGGLASGFVDGCTVLFSVAEIERAQAEEREKSATTKSDEEKKAREQKKQAEKRKNEDRSWYMTQAAKLDFKPPYIPSDTSPPLNLLEPDFSHLPDSSWFGLDVKFTLQTPWYSKDDRAFHLLDNPVRKDRVFGVPFMSAAAWKGLLRWACRMQAGLFGHLKEHDLKMDGWKDPPWIIHLFGNEKGEKKDFESGALAFYPTWFDKIGFEVINPHRRVLRAGTQPIYYEVVPAGTEGRLRLLYAPRPGEIEKDQTNLAEVLSILVEAIDDLFQKYGISAKRTAGWGAARIHEWTPFPKNGKPAKTAQEFKEEIKRRFVRKGGGR